MRKGAEIPKTHRPAAGPSAPQQAGLPPVVQDGVRSPGRSLDSATRRFMEPRFGYDFSHVRVHTDARAGASAEAMGAAAYTVGADLVFGRGRYRPETSAGRRRLAHELAHVVQQQGAAPAQRLVPATPAAEQEARQAALDVMNGAVPPKLSAAPVGLACDLDDPTRFEQVHRNLFVDAPGAGQRTLRTWTADTPAALVQAFRQALRQAVEQRPLSVLGWAPSGTSQADAETDALQADQRIRARFAMIPGGLSAAEVRGRVTVFQADQGVTEDFLRQWMANRLILWTDIEEFGVLESDPRFEQVVTTIISDRSAFDFTPALDALRRALRSSGRLPSEVASIMQDQEQIAAGRTWRWVLERLAGRVGAFESGGQVSLSSGLDTRQRQLTLLHELTHAYANADFLRWVEGTTAPRFHNEGFTEYLARLVMTPDERSVRNSYESRVEAIEQEVAPFVSEDDIARAYFLGEVWRLEGTSAVAQEQFETQVGLREGATRPEEVAQSASAAGIVQEVEPGRRYRFMNLGIDDAAPRPEHRAALERLIDTLVRSDPAVRLRFVGHASSPGSAQHNAALARRRSAAFYALARQLGVPEAQLIEARRPPHEGERVPTAPNASVRGRAFNRRVEVFIIRAQDGAE